MALLWQISDTPTSVVSMEKPGIVMERGRTGLIFTGSTISILTFFTLSRTDCPFFFRAFVFIGLHLHRSLALPYIFSPVKIPGIFHQVIPPFEFPREERHLDNLQHILIALADLPEIPLLYLPA